MMLNRDLDVNMMLNRDQVTFSNIWWTETGSLLNIVDQWLGHRPPNVGEGDLVAIHLVAIHLECSGDPGIEGAAGRPRLHIGVGARAPQPWRVVARAGTSGSRGLSDFHAGSVAD